MASRSIKSIRGTGYIHGRRRMYPRKSLRAENARPAGKAHLELVVSQLQNVDFVVTQPWDMSLAQWMHPRLSLPRLDVGAEHGA